MILAAINLRVRGLNTGQALDIVSRDGRLEIVPEPIPVRLVDEGDGLVAVADVEMPPLTVDLVRDTLEQVRR